MIPHYIVKIHKVTTFYDEWYIKRVIDYNKLKVVLYPWKDYAFKYINKSNAEKAAEAFNGKVEMV